MITSNIAQISREGPCLATIIVFFTRDIATVDLGKIRFFVSFRKNLPKTLKKVRFIEENLGAAEKKIGAF